jgi:Ser/Thr protein kinase RdoA (MazF antagonist)
MDDVLLRTPSFKAEDARELAHTVFGVDGEVSPLPSERDQNFLIQTSMGGDRFVLKIANASDGRALLEAQNDALLHIARRSALCPRVIPARDGATISEAVSDGNVRHFVRLFTFLPGEPLATSPQTAGLLEDLGRKVAELDAALEGFDHPAIHRGFYWDLAQGIALVREWAPLVEDEGMRALVGRLVDRIESRDGARLIRLRRSAVHNDPNDYNVLVSLPPEGGSHQSGHAPHGPFAAPHVASASSHVASALRRKIVGILDFGDIVHSYAIADLAIAIAYAVLGKDDPLGSAVSVVRGYQDVRPLDDDEIASLFGLVLLRLCTSVCVAARQQKRRPDDK